MSKRLQIETTTKKKLQPSSVAVFSQVQQVNLKNKIWAPPRGIYLLTQQFFLENSTSRLWGEKKFAVKLKKK